MREKGKISEAKKQATLQLSKEIVKHKVIAVADLRKVRSSQIMEIRKKMRGKVNMFVTKNSLVKKAAEQIGDERKNLKKFTESLSGPSLFLLTEMNPYELKNALDKNKVRVAAKGGDIADSDVLVSAGNTGLSPGPVISEFTEAKIPTKIESGSIYVSKDIVAVRKGEVISAKLASVLSKLGMKPMEAGLQLIMAYDEGTVLNTEDLRFDISEYEKNFRIAATNAQWLAVEITYLTPESAPMIFSKACRQAIQLSLESEYPAVDVMPEMLRNAFLEMKALSGQLATKNKEAAPPSYEAPPAVVEALKLEVTQPPVKTKPIPVQTEKRVASEVAKPIPVSPPAKEMKAEPVQIVPKPLEKHERAAVPRPTRKAPPQIVAEEATVKKPSRKPISSVEHKKKITEKKASPAKKRKPTVKEKAKRGKAKSP